MTVSKKEKTITHNNRSNILILNIGLVAFLVLFLVIYIVGINKITHLRYKVGQLKTGLIKENLLTQNYLDEQQHGLQGLLTFAHARGMIEVTNYDSFFEENGVALK